MNDTFNPYGDKFIPTQQGHGVDISSQRQDELDQLSLAFVSQRITSGQSVNAVDLGGGLGTHAARLAEAGACVTMIDSVDMASEKFDQAIRDRNIPRDRLVFIQKDFSQISASDIPQQLDLVYSQRAIHYVPYHTAKNVLTLLFNKMNNKGMIFISAAGIDTEYGKTYPDRDKSVEDRFNYVLPDMQVKHAIAHKIVVYSQEELAALLTSVGFTDINVTQSEFGNIKAYGSKPSI